MFATYSPILLFFLLDSTASGLLGPVWSFGSSGFERNVLRIVVDPLRSEAMIAEGLRFDKISCRTKEGLREFEFGFSGISLNPFEDWWRLWLNDVCWLALVLAAKFSADEPADDNSWLWSDPLGIPLLDWVSEFSPSSTIDSCLLSCLCDDVSTSLKRNSHK